MKTKTTKKAQETLNREMANLCTKCFEHPAHVRLGYYVEHLEVNGEETYHEIGSLCIQCMVETMVGVDA